ncbi:hypothetical protein AVEN_130098-1 [Araneus ventricosus]|uniref:Uncharacterized protein n=1 Tax=Araneus ventricosus TaxID=182803 RepID=A0A4Y2EK57_ARAVE|nr:hypothetical protein AVEN_130098-1 [Araneus ventricosus]
MGHIGIAGNEAADRAAKRASEKSAIDIHLGTPLRSLKTTLRRILLSEWQSTWDNDGTKGRFTHNILRDVKTSRCIDNIYLSQILTNHGLYPHYLKRFNLRNCNCRCGKDMQDGILHYFFVCPLFHHIRTNIQHDTPVTKIISTPKLATEAKTILKEIYMHQQDVFEFFV